MNHPTETFFRQIQTPFGESLRFNAVRVLNAKLDQPVPHKKPKPKPDFFSWLRQCESK